MRGLSRFFLRWGFCLGFCSVYAQAPSFRDTLAYTQGLLSAQRALLLGRLDEAAGHLERLSDSQAPASVYFLWARLHMHKKSLGEARASIAEAIRRAPQQRHYHEWAIALEDKALAPHQAAARTEDLLTHCRPSPRRPALLRRLFGLYLELGQPKNALRILDSIAHYKADSPIWMDMQRTQLLYATGQTQEARTRFQALAHKYATDEEIQIAYARFLAQDQRLAEAITHLVRARKDLFAESALVLEALLDLYLEGKQTTLALEALQALFLAKDLALEDKLLGLVRAERALDLSKARLKELRRGLLDVHANRPAAWIATADLMLRAQEPLLAQHDYLKATELGFHSLLLWQNVISIDLEQGAYGAAILRAKEALIRYEEEPMLYWMMGMAQYFEKTYSDALEAFSRCVQYAEWVDAELASNAHAQRADIYYELEDKPNAYSAYAAAIELNPDNDHALNNYSYFLAESGERLSEALRMSSHLMQLEPNEVSYLDTHAWVLYKLKRYKEALRFLKKALALNPSASGTIVEHYGDVLYALGRKKQALQQWRLAQQRGETSSGIQSKINTLKP